MKCLIVNTFENEGGAARAAHRLHLGLQDIGVESAMLVQFKTSDEPSVLGPKRKIDKGFNKLRPHLDVLPLQLYRNRRNALWGLGWVPSNVVCDQVRDLRPDIVHLNWISAGFLPLAALRSINRPIVWTLHDSWAFTGGCHIPYECTRYRQSCGACPLLGSGKDNDLSRWVWKRKARFWKELNLTVVTPSKWLAECAKASALFRNTKVEVIPNGLNLSLYKPSDRFFARELLGLPRDKKLILFGAIGSLGDHNKGFHHLQEALKQLAAAGWGEKAELVVFGASSANSPDLGLKANYLGRLYDDVSLALLYSAADVFVAPSIQENLPNTVMEALACGTPSVAFNIGGMPDMIKHQCNGYLARPFEPSDLAQGITWVLSDDERWKMLSRQAREKVERDYNIDMVAKQYLNLYSNILS
ncbi:MAG: glycosyltransferase family 4 protein [Eubacteriales bacterium]